jgi:hypothetical protein
MTSERIRESAITMLLLIKMIGWLIFMKLKNNWERKRERKWDSVVCV